VRERTIRIIATRHGSGGRAIEDIGRWIGDVGDGKLVASAERVSPHGKLEPMQVIDFGDFIRDDFS
jgi:hypothetical protein